jgi:hypothetical protein
MRFRCYQSGWGCQILLQVFEGLLSPLELVLLIKELSLKKGSLLMPSREMNLLKAAMHPINFYTSWRLSGGFILVLAVTFSGFGSIPRREIIYPSNFPDCKLNVHFSGFSFILNFLRLLKVPARLEMNLSSS